MSKKKFRRLDSAVNAGSMADIAFLLLIFFLVTTTIINDKGIRVALPPYTDIDTPPPPSKNVLSVKVNKQNQLLVEKELASIDKLKVMTMDFIMNPRKEKSKPSKPTKAVISLQNDRGTAYETYIQVYNEIRAAYNELWDRQARQEYGVAYKNLPKTHQKAVRKIIPLVISEAEPSNFSELGS